MRVRDWFSWCALAATTVAAIVLIGGAFRWAQAVVAILAVVSLAVTLTSRRAMSRLSPLLATLIAAGAVSAFALIPLPGSIREQLDPVGFALREDGAGLVGVHAWPVLARDVAAALSSVAFFTILSGVAVVALRLAPSERGRIRLLACTAAACATVAAIGGLHELVGAKQLYGIYEVRHASPTILAPLLNENHFASLMALGTSVALGLTLHARLTARARIASLVAALICAGTAAASGSRGGFIALIVGVGVVAATFAAQRLTKEAPQRSRRASLVTSSLPLSVIGACVVTLIIYAGAGKVTQELSHTSIHEVQQPRSKFSAWRSARPLVEESPWVGVTRGGFESSFTRVHAASGTVTFSYLENEYLQSVVDWGIPGALLVGGAVLWFWLVALKCWRDGAVTAGALGGLVAVAVHSSVDYGIELLGLAVPVTVVAATVSYVPIREITGGLRWKTVGIRLAHIGLIAAAAALLLSNATRTLREDHDDLQRGATNMAAVRETVRRHPLDYFSFALAAGASQRESRGQTIRLLNHALLLNPNHPELHRMAARILFSAGYQEQALVEYETALRTSAAPRALIAELATRYPSSSAARALPIDIANLAPILEELRDMKRDDIISVWFSRILSARPQDISICNLVYEFSIERGDISTAEMVGRKCVALLPDHQSRLNLAKLLVSKGSHTEAILLVSDAPSWTGRIADQLAAWTLLCDSHIALEQFDEAKTCLRQLDRAGLLAIEQRTQITERLEKVEEARRQKELGRGASGSAVAPSPTTPGPAPSSPPAGATPPH